MNISVVWSGGVLAWCQSRSLCRALQLFFPSLLVLKVKGLGAVFSARIAVLARI